MSSLNPIKLNCLSLNAVVRFFYYKLIRARSFLYTVFNVPVLSSFSSNFHFPLSFTSVVILTGIPTKCFLPLPLASIIGKLKLVPSYFLYTYPQKPMVGSTVGHMLLYSNRLTTTIERMIEGRSGRKGPWQKKIDGIKRRKKVIRLSTENKKLQADQPLS